MEIKLRELRERKNLSMRETAKLFGIPYTTYIGYEKGYREPKFETLIAIADFYDVHSIICSGEKGVENMTKIKRGIADIDTALRIYYQYPEITNKEISELFGGLSRASALAYKRRVQDEQVKRDIKTHQKFAVNTAVAYEVFGIDVDDLERRRAKLQKLGLTG